MQRFYDEINSHIYLNDREVNSREDLRFYEGKKAGRIH